MAEFVAKQFRGQKVHTQQPSSAETPGEDAEELEARLNVWMESETRFAWE